jgi:NAD(P)-dependent dehydrogenase (short-subunit alcohol dehydrogenase family)
MRLDGRVAVITGGASGIGRATALAMVAEGARVVIGDVDTEGAATLVEEVSARGGEAAFVRTDVRVADDCGALMAAAEERFGALHILFANAGVSWPGRDGFSPDVDPAVWDEVIGINLSGVFYCAHHAIPRMAAAGGGAIVNTASSMGVLPLGGLDAYAASKGGVAMLTRSLAADAGVLGIRVNAIAPGYVETPLTSMIWEIDDVRDAFARHHATGLQTAAEIADAVVFLASDDARSLTGTVLTCDRGWAAFKRPEMLAPRPPGDAG